MDAIAEAIGPVSVTQRVIIALVLAAVILTVLILLTSLVTRLRTALILWPGLIVAGVLALAFWPVDTSGLSADPNPVADYDAAVARFEAQNGSFPQTMNPLCLPELLTHGEKTGRVVVLLHGVSSCPRAFVDFAPMLHERGDTVMTVLLPEHGFANRATDAMRDITAQQLRAMVDNAVDIAVGLGDEVVVLGISAGGTAAAWAAQNRSDVDRAVLVAPFMGLAGFGPMVNRALMNAQLWLPNVKLWKDPKLRGDWNGMPHAYASQATRGIGQIMRLGYSVLDQAARERAAAGEVAFVLNDNDKAVSNDVTIALQDRWEKQGTPILAYTFDAAEGLGHELIDPKEPGANPPLTYPIIADMIAGIEPQ